MSDTDGVYFTPSIFINFVKKGWTIRQKYVKIYFSTNVLYTNVRSERGKLEMENAIGIFSNLVNMAIPALIFIFLNDILFLFNYVY